MYTNSNYLPQLPYDRARVRTRLAFTLVELLVVIAIIAMLVTALFPAINAMRENSRRLSCSSNVTRLMLAVQGFEMAHEYFPIGVTDPAGGPIRSVANGGHHHGWMIQAMPYMDEEALFRSVDIAESVYADSNRAARERNLPQLVCPSAEESTWVGNSSYAGCHHDVEAPIDSTNLGAFILNTELSRQDIADGVQYTLFVGEKRIPPLGDLGWMSGTRATLRNTGSPLAIGPFRDGKYLAAPVEKKKKRAPVDNAEAAKAENAASAETSDDVWRVVDPMTDPMEVGGFGSMHATGAHMGFGDARVEFMAAGVDPVVMQQIGNRNDGKLPAAFE